MGFRSFFSSKSGGTESRSGIAMPQGSDDSVFLQAIDSHFGRRPGRNADTAALRARLDQVISNRLHERHAAPGGHVQTGFAHVFKSGDGNYLVADQGTSAQHDKPLQHRSKSEVRLHILLQSQLRSIDKHDDLKSADSVTQEDIDTQGTSKSKWFKRRITKRFSFLTRLFKRHRVDTPHDISFNKAPRPPVRLSNASPDRIAFPNRQGAAPVRAAPMPSVPTAPTVPATPLVPPAPPNTPTSGVVFHGCELAPYQRPSRARHFAGNAHQSPGNRPQFRFHGANDRNGLFSNFWVGPPIRIGGQEWKSAEHYFQAQKFSPSFGDGADTLRVKQQIREEIRSAPTPNDTKQIPRRRCPRSGQQPQPGQVSVDWANWNSKRIDVMYDALHAKFSQDPALRAALLHTNGAALVETMPRDRTDDFWGAIVTGDPEPGAARGVNMLGRVLEAVREELQNPGRVDRKAALNSAQSDAQW